MTATAKRFKAKLGTKSRRAKAAWDRLSYSHQREYAEHIAGARRPTTVAARVAKAIAALRGDG